jgi:hypothetical protein
MPVTADRNGSGDAVGFNFNPDANKVQPGGEFQCSGNPDQRNQLRERLELRY